MYTHVLDIRVCDENDCYLKLFWRWKLVEIESSTNEVSKEVNDEGDWSDNPRRQHAYIWMYTPHDLELWLAETVSTSVVRRDVEIPQVKGDEWTKKYQVLNLLKRMYTRLRREHNRGYVWNEADRLAPDDRSIRLSGSFSSKHARSRQEWKCARLCYVGVPPTSSFSLAQVLFARRLIFFFHPRHDWRGLMQKESSADENL